MRAPAAAADLQGQLEWAYLLAGPTHARLEQDLRHCGFKLKGLTLSTRSWICPDCGSMHDRDKSAVRNILAAGVQAISTAWRAGSLKPVERVEAWEGNTPLRRPVAKQEPEL